MCYLICKYMINNNVPHCNRQSRPSIACPKIAPPWLIIASRSFMRVSNTSSVRMHSRRTRWFVSGLRRATTLGQSWNLCSAKTALRLFFASSNVSCGILTWCSTGLLGCASGSQAATKECIDTAVRWIKNTYKSRNTQR